VTEVYKNLFVESEHDEVAVRPWDRGWTPIGAARKERAGEPLNVSLEMAESSYGLPKPIRSALRGVGYAFSDDWCGRPASNRHSPFGPTDFHTRYGFRRPILCACAQDGFGVWTIPSP